MANIAISAQQSSSASTSNPERSKPKSTDEVHPGKAKPTATELNKQSEATKPRRPTTVYSHYEAMRVFIKGEVPLEKI